MVLGYGRKTGSFQLRTSPDQIDPRPPRIVVRECEHVPCSAGRGDVEWPTEICIDPL